MSDNEFVCEYYRLKFAPHFEDSPEGPGNMQFYTSWVVLEMWSMSQIRWNPAVKRRVRCSGEDTGWVPKKVDLKN